MKMNLPFFSSLMGRLAGYYMIKMSSFVAGAGSKLCLTFRRSEGNRLCMGCCLREIGLPRSSAVKQEEPVSLANSAEKMRNRGNHYHLDTPQAVYVEQHCVFSGVILE